MEEHCDSGDDDAAEHGAGFKEGGDGYELQFEDVPGGEGGEVRPLEGCAAFFENGLGFDLEELELDQFVIFVEAAETGEDVASFGLAAMVD